MPKFSSTLLIVALSIGSQHNSHTLADAFSVASSAGHKHHNTRTATALHATIEKTSLKAPSDIPDDDIPGMFEQYVQKTYG